MRRKSMTKNKFWMKVLTLYIFQNDGLLLVSPPRFVPWLERLEAVCL